MKSIELIKECFVFTAIGEYRRVKTVFYWISVYLLFNSKTFRNEFEWQWTLYTPYSNGWTCVNTCAFKAIPIDDPFDIISDFN